MKYKTIVNVEVTMKKAFILFIVGLFSIQANASNWVRLPSSSDTLRTYIDLDSIRPYKEGDAKNSKDNYRSAFIEFDFRHAPLPSIKVVRIMHLYVVNCDKNKLIILDSMSFDAEDNIVVPQEDTVLSDSNMKTVFPKTKVAYIHTLMCF